MPEVLKHDDQWYVLKGANDAQRAWCKSKLETETKIVGDRLFFKPNAEVCRLLAGTSTIEFNAPVVGSIEVDRKVTFAHKVKPYPHQEQILDKAAALPGYALFWEMGLGKSKTALDIAAWKFIDNKIDAILVITLKGVHTNWITKEVPQHLSIDHDAFAWPLKKSQAHIPLETKKLSVLAVNFDTIWRDKALGYLKNFLQTRRVMMIVDESHNIKTHSAKRTKQILQFAKMCQHRLILTGTPITNSPLDAWSQMQVVNPRIWDNKDYFLFERRYAVKKKLPGVTYTTKKGIVKPVEVIVGYQNIDEIQGKMAPYMSRLKKDDVLDLPEKLYNQQVFDMSPEQVRLYNTLVEDGAAELDAGRLSIENALVLKTRLHQISCGLYVTDDGETVRLDKNPRFDAFINVEEQIDDKAIVWATFKHSVEDIFAYLSKKYGPQSVVVYTGATKDKDRTEHVHRFQNDPECRWFVGNPVAGGTGITLTAARDTLYYSHSFRYDIRLQSEDRNHRIGQEYAVTYTDLLARGSVDEDFVMSYLKKDEMAATITGDEIRKWLRPIPASS